MINIKNYNYAFELFFVITIISIVITFSLNYLFLSDGLYYQSFGEKIATDRIAKIIEQSQKWQWLGYLFVPIAILTRVGFTATCIYIGLFVANLKVRFRELFKVALLADFVFVMAGLVKLVILIFFKEVNTLGDLQFQPLSLMELFDRKSVDVLFIYPLSIISAFELIYWLTLAWLLTGVVEEPLGSSLKTRFGFCS